MVVVEVEKEERRKENKRMKKIKRVRKKKTQLRYLLTNFSYDKNLSIITDR